MSIGTLLLCFLPTSYAQYCFQQLILSAHFQQLILSAHQLYLFLAINIYSLPTSYTQCVSSAVVSSHWLENIWDVHQSRMCLCASRSPCADIRGWEYVHKNSRHLSQIKRHQSFYVDHSLCVWHWQGAYGWIQQIKNSCRLTLPNCPPAVLLFLLFCSPAFIFLMFVKHFLFQDANFIGFFKAYIVHCFCDDWTHGV